ncbi:MAG: glycosyl hydrolase [Bacillota bacterium]
MKSSIMSEFQSPPARYRGKPFWAWNGKLSPAELKTQIQNMHTMGLGGFFMHSRVGLDTPYLSDEWFECVNACIDEAARLGMEAWLYDEDRWPSGAAGGFVTKNPAFRMRHLEIEILEDIPAVLDRKGILAVFTGFLEKQKLTRAEPVRDPGRIKLENGKRLVIFRSVISKTSDWFNGCSYLDTMNHKAVRNFIARTHDAYRKRIGKHFGAAVPGIFTDEPNFDDGWENGDRPCAVFPWTDRLPRVFRKRYGYDIIEHLPEIFFDAEEAGISEARFHYMDCVTHLFVDAFARQIGQWCGRNNLFFTGHVLCEEMLSTQASKAGSPMRFYEHMQAPGMDLLTQYNREYDTAKQVSSVARQTGSLWRITETYGCTGWDFPWEGHKALGDWQAALGINVRCQHLAWYTMEGEAKRDYPASIFYQSPWWDKYRYVEDYFARINAIMTRGEEVRDLLVIHPVESMWQHIKYGWNLNRDMLNRMNRSFIDLRDRILEANIDFDYGDEEMLSRLGGITVLYGRPRLTLGRASYTTVLVPEMLTIRSTTVALLKRFKEQGGTVLFVGRAPGHVDGKASARAMEFAAQCPSCAEPGTDMISILSDSARRVSITDRSGAQIKGLLHLLREDADAFYLFICNTSHEFTSPARWPVGDSHINERTLEFAEVKITGFAECQGSPILCDPERGTIHAANASYAGGRWEILTSLPRFGSRLFIAPKKTSTLALSPMLKTRTTNERELNGKLWEVQLSEPNVCVLDRAYYAVGNEPFREPDEILRIDSNIRASMKIPVRGGSMKQPWARSRRNDPPAKSVRIKYVFNVKALPRGNMLLALERPELYEIRINAAPVDTSRPRGFWVDRSLQTLAIDPALIRLGENKLELSCNYSENHPGLEIVYLLGDFGVVAEGADITLTAWNYRLETGDWTMQGLPFYSGAVTYLTELELNRGQGRRYIIRVPEFLGAAVQIFIDGVPAGIIAWPPYELDITDSINRKRFILGIQVMGHRRNSHGPLHFNMKNPSWTGPGEFRTTGDRWSLEYRLVPCGLMRNPLLIETEQAE